MKIIVCTSFFPTREHPDVPKFVQDQVSAIRKARPGLDITVLCPAFGENNTPIAHEYPVEFFNYFWPRHSQKLAGSGMMPALKANHLLWVQVPFLFVCQFFALLKLTRKQRPDYIYAHWFTPQGINAGLVGKITKTPFVFTSHSSDVMVWKAVPFLGKRIVGYFVRSASAVSVVSSRSLAKVQHFFSKSEWLEVNDKVHIIPMGVSIQNKRHAKKKAKKITNILFIGRLVEKKGVSFLIEAFSIVSSRLGENLTLTIAGDGELKSSLEEMVARLDLSNNVRFVGFVSGKEKENLLETADILVVPSIITASGDAEGLPVSLLEGLAAGKLCIATDESGADDIIADGGNGFMVKGGDTPALAKSLEKVIALDDKERQNVQSNALKLSKNFSWEVIANKHLDLLFPDV